MHKSLMLDLAKKRSQECSMKSSLSLTFFLAECWLCRKWSRSGCQKHILVLVCNEDDGKTLVHHVPIETSPGSIWFPNRLSWHNIHKNLISYCSQQVLETRWLPAETRTWKTKNVIFQTKQIGKLQEALRSNFVFSSGYDVHVAIWLLWKEN